MPVTVYPGREAFLDEVCAGWLGGDLGPRIKDDAVRYAPLGVSTPATRRWPAHEAGELKASIEDHLDGPRHLIIEAHAPYAAWVEMGVEPREIRAKGPWSLHALDATRDIYFGAVVPRWPGFAGRHYLRNALYRAR